MSENFSVKNLPFAYKGTERAVREWGFSYAPALFNLEKVSSLEERCTMQPDME